MTPAGDTRSRVIQLDGSEWVFECPGCHCLHALDKRWTFNGDVVRPTFSPSLLIQGVVDAESDPTPTRCHVFISDGRIQFLADCTHALAGQTVDMEPWR